MLKKFFLLVILAATVTTSGCGWFDRYVVSNVKGHSNECVEGVSYLQFPSGVTVQYGTDSKVKTC